MLTFSTQTIYTTNADVTLLNTILNGVAMICQQTGMIWGFALFAAIWRIVSMTTQATIKSVSSGDTGMAQNVLSSLVPFVLAILLTAPSLQTDVVVESSINGRTTLVSNVPIVLSIVPATASLLSTDVGTVVRTAFQGSGTNYPALSAYRQGFINPLKVLLTSRTAILKMGSVHSQVNAVISSCLGSDVGADYSSIYALVANAGNTGATSTTSISVYDGAGTAPTAIGALLYQASLNPNGVVTDVAVNGNDVVSCFDAANAVAANINTALYSSEFARVVQGAVNSADQPNTGGSFGITTLSTTYLAVRTANTATNTLAGGVTQANAEMINMLFSEMLKNNLDCLKADGANKTTCLAMSVQGNEIERNNIQSAANGVEGLLYAGQFSNYITALIIGLGPIIVMLMMFSGVSSGKNMRVAVHMIVWPILIMNVGAELINGMIYSNVANFMTTIAQGGYLSQAVMVEVYKAFSLQIGTASHLIATLPILMTTIFALGESAAVVSIAKSMGSGGTKVSDSVAPAAVNSAPLVSNSSMATAKQGAGFNVTSGTGALNAVSTRSEFGSMAREAGHVISAAEAKQKTISAGQTDMASWKRAFSTGDYSRWGLNKSEGEAIKKSYERNLGARAGKTDAEGITGTRANSNSTNISGGGSLKLSAAGLSGSATVGATTQTAANDTKSTAVSASRDTALNESNALGQALTEDKAVSRYRNSGGDKSKNLTASLDTQKTYASTLSGTSSVSDTTSIALKKSQAFVEQSSQIGSTEIAAQMERNGEFNRFQLLEGKTFDRLEALDKYKQKANADMDSGATDVISNPAAREAAVRHRAAVLLANDESATPEDRLKADRYLVDSAQAMQAIRFQSGDTSMKPLNIDSPLNATGVDRPGLERDGNRLIPVRPASHAGTTPATTPGVKAAPGSGIPITKKPKPTPPPQDDPLGAGDFKQQVTGAVKRTKDRVENADENARRSAADSGLDKDGHGTAIRAAANLVNNAATAVGDGPSRVLLGDLDKKPNAPRAVPPKAAPPKKEDPLPPMPKL